MPALALFDLDHTLLAGDSDVLWCEFLVRRGVLGDEFRARNAAMERRYQAGEADAAEFSGFYAATLADRSPLDWLPVRDAFMADAVLPRVPDAAHALVQQHRARGDLLVLTTASNRFIVEATAEALGFTHVIATELEQHADGRYTGRTAGTLNMREGKVGRLQAWLAARALPAEPALAGACFYSDSINDLPLLAAVGRPVAVDPDAKLAAEAAARGWPVISLHR